MALTVTDDTGTITIAIGTRRISMVKGKVTVKADGDNVIITDNEEIITYPYGQFTAPSGASAIAVAASIEAFLDTASSQSVTVTSVPADPFGTNADAIVASGAAGSMQAKFRRITQSLQDLLDSLATEATLGALNDRIGTTTDPIVAAGAVGTFSSKMRRVTQGLEDLKTLIVLAAGENFIGSMGGKTFTLAATQTTNASAYEAGDCVGGKITITNAMRVSGGTGILQSIHLTDKGNQKAALEILIFNADPTAATITDDTAFVYSTDISKQIARISIGVGDYTTINGIATVSLGGLSRLLKAVGSQNLYAVIITTGTPTYTSTSDIILEFGILQD